MISEQVFLDWLKERFNQKNDNGLIGIGDDCAVVPVSKTKSLLYTCDSLVENIHFKLKYTTPIQIGQKAINVNVSDIASMGAVPKYCLVSLFLPKKISSNFVIKLYDGLQIAGHEFGVTIIGGNTSSSNKLAIDIFMIGEAKSNQLLTRNKAKPGDLICVTGTLGDSAAGLKLLNSKNVSFKRGRLAKLDFEYLINRQLEPTARLKESQQIIKTGGATSMVDLSDGLSTDINHICDLSRVGVEIYNDKLPFSTSLVNFCKQLKLDPIDFALNGGEDYELCFTVSKNKAKNLIKNVTKKTGTKISIIGKITESKINLKPQGWDHFK